jgi:exopolysaccharide biosynthesis polyprenyl glycosylphosphotransferase
MAALGLFECGLSFAVIDSMIQVAGVPSALPAILSMLPRADIALAALLTILIAAVALTIGLYRPEICLHRKRLLIATGLAAVIVFAVLRSFSAAPPGSLTGVPSMYMAEVLAAWLATTALIRLAYGFAISRTVTARRILILGEPRDVGTFTARLRSARGHRLDPIVLPGQALSWHMLRKQSIWAVVVASEPDGQTLESLVDCKLRGIPVFSGAAFQERYLRRIDLDTLTTNDLLLTEGFTSGRISATLKRLCDLAVGTALLVLLLPLMAMTAVAVKLDSPGSVFYRQQRVGRFDTTFTLFKFRSMKADAEASGSPRWAQKQDPRITRVGRFMRATRIDELPQLTNVIRGEMSLVGPRPERRHFVEQLARSIPFYRQRTYVKPGLTGWAQVNFPYGASVEDAREKLAYDLFYVKNRTIILDVLILISTIRVVLFREGAR